ncbi:MAG: hypothetical protein JXQ76_08895 [Campylobacterales bacterium]|nr:hypothetical protein [Campylobacterales bacterium]
MPKSKLIFSGLITLYLLYTFATAFYPLSSEIGTSKAKSNKLNTQDISAYKQLEGNLTALAIHTIWDIPAYNPPQPKVAKVDTNETNETHRFELRNQNGFYTIIIDKKEFDFLGVAKRGDQALAIFFDALRKSNDKLVEYLERSTIHASVQLHKIYENYILLIDTKTYKKIKIPYFLVEKLKYDTNTTEVANSVTGKTHRAKNNRKKFGKKGWKKMSKEERKKLREERMKKRKERRNKGNKK